MSKLLHLTTVLQHEMTRLSNLVPFKNIYIVNSDSVSHQLQHDANCDGQFSISATDYDTSNIIHID